MPHGCNCILSTSHCAYAWMHYFFHYGYRCITTGVSGSVTVQGLEGFLLGVASGLPFGVSDPHDYEVLGSSMEGLSSRLQTVLELNIGALNSAGKISRREQAFREPVPHHWSSD